MSSAKRGRLKVTILVAVAATCLILVYSTPLRGGVETWFERTDERLRELGPLGGALFIGVAAVLTAFGTPRLLFAAIAGALFGWWIGAFLAETSALLGCWITFRLGRWLGRGYVEQRMGSPERGVGLLLEKARTHGVAANILIRSAPVGNFFATNLLMAISPISTRDLLLGTLIGTLPGTVVFALFGADARAGVGLWAGLGCALFLGWAVLFWLFLRPRVARHLGYGPNNHTR
ncbi:MAG: VTT domain-containing protein [Planctomycetota bacterium]